jgi:hypothetical protein
MTLYRALNKNEGNDNAVCVCVCARARARCITEVYVEGMKLMLHMCQM